MACEGNGKSKFAHEDRSICIEHHSLGFRAMNRSYFLHLTLFAFFTAQQQPCCLQGRKKFPQHGALRIVVQPRVEPHVPSQLLYAVGSNASYLSDLRVVERLRIPGTQESLEL